jgi:hypothetical protein
MRYGMRPLWPGISFHELRKLLCGDAAKLISIPAVP